MKISSEIVTGLFQAIESGNSEKVLEILANNETVDELVQNQQAEKLIYAAEKAYREFLTYHPETVKLDNAVNDTSSKTSTETMNRGLISKQIILKFRHALKDSENIALFQAIKKYDLDGVKDSLSKSKDLNIIDRNGSTLLSYAVMQALVNDLNPSDYENIIHIITYLLEQGADPNISCNETPLYLAIYINDQRITNLLLDYNANPNYFSYHSLDLPNESDRTLPIMAALDENMIQLLLDKGAHLSTPDQHLPILSFHLAHYNWARKERIKSNQTEPSSFEQQEFKIVKLLLKNKENPNQRAVFGSKNVFDDFIKSSLQLKYLDINMVKLLLEHGAKPNDPSFTREDLIKDEKMLKEFCRKQLQTSRIFRESPLEHKNHEKFEKVEVQEKQTSFLREIFSEIWNFITKLFTGDREAARDTLNNFHQTKQSISDHNISKPLNYIGDSPSQTKERTHNPLRQKDQKNNIR